MPWDRKWLPTNLPPSAWHILQVPIMIFRLFAMSPLSRTEVRARFFQKALVRRVKLGRTIKEMRDTARESLRLKMAIDRTQ
jgi:hypothetical protein